MGAPITTRSRRLFKAFARALRVACSRDKQLGEMLPCTKGLVVMRVTVIDYKAGNLTSVLKALHASWCDAVVTDRDLCTDRVGGAVVLPGVGHFAATGACDDDRH